MPARGKPFKPGQSGNPAGRALGSRNATTLAVEALLEGDAETLTTKAIELAKAGDVQALRLCMDRIAPVRKGHPVAFDMPPVSNSNDVRALSLALLTNVAAGNLTPEEAAALVPLVESTRRVMETVEVIERLDKIEADAAKGKA